MAYRSLNSTYIFATLEKLRHRIEERFPGSGLSAVAKELEALGRFCAREAEELGKPHWPIRGAAALLIAGVVVLSRPVAEDLAEADDSRNGGDERSRQLA